MLRKTSSHISVPLNIPNVKVIETKIKKDNSLFIQVESEQETTECGICGQQIRCNYGKDREIKLRHLSVFGMKTVIGIRPKRGQCGTCENQPTTTQVLTWYKQRSPHTKAYDQYLLKQLVSSTIAEVELKENVGYEAILGTIKRHVKTEIEWEEIEDLQTIGIDEIAMKKGRKEYAAIVTARQEDGQVKILGVLADRKKNDTSLPRHDSDSFAVNNSEFHD